MKKMGVVLAVMLTVCFGAKADIIWSDGFELGDFSAWTTANGNWLVGSGSASHTGEKRGQVAGETGTGGDILLLQISTAGYENLEITWWYRVYYNLEVADYVSAEYTANGTEWQELARYTNSVITGWAEESASLPESAEDNELFAFRLRAVLGSASDSVYFDDFKLSGQLIPEPASIAILSFALPAIFLRARRKL